MHFHRRNLPFVREQLGLSALELARRADCPVETVVRAEMGLSLPTADPERQRLAKGYGIPLDEFLRLALDAADRRERAR